MADKRNRKLSKALEEAKLHAEAIHLTCSCVNWMGGCKREWRCAYGHVKNIREAIDTAQEAENGKR